MNGYADAHIHPVVLPQPAAGAGATYVQGGATTAEVLAVTFRLVTSAAVATRTPAVELLGTDGTIFALAVAGYAATATTDVTYCFAKGLGEWDQGGNVLASGPCPAFVLSVGYSLAIVVNGVQAADQVSAIRLVLAQWSTRDDG